MTEERKKEVMAAYLEDAAKAKEVLKELGFEVRPTMSPHERPDVRGVQGNMEIVIGVPDTSWGKAITHYTVYGVLKKWSSSDKIKISKTKTVSQMAREIKRRFLPMYQEKLGLSLEQDRKEKEHIAGKRKTYELLSKLAGKETKKEVTFDIDPTIEMPYHFKARVSSSNSVTFQNNCAVPEELARRLIKEIVRYKKEHPED